MALIVREVVSKELGSPPVDASRFYIMVPSFYLSEAYGVMSGDRVFGKIIKIENVDFDTSELEGKPIELIFRKGTVYDHLYISKKDWDENFREFGLVEPGYRIEIRLDEVLLHTGERVKLYSKRDVKL